METYPQVVAGRRFNFNTRFFESSWTVYTAETETCPHRHKSERAARACAAKIAKEASA